MSRKRSELSDAILWRRERPGTCDLASSGRRRGVGTQGDVQGAGRPATALGWGEASSTGRSLGRPWTAEHIPAAPAFRNGSAGANRPPPSAQASHASLASRGSSLPPLPRGAVTTAWLAAPSTARSGAASAPLTTLSYVPGTDPAPAELLGDFQEALYQNCHPQQTTSRLLRLGAGTPGPGTGTGRFTRRAQSPNLAAGASSMGVGAPSGRGGSPGIPLPGTGHVGGGGGGGGGGAATARAASPGLRTMSPPPLNPAALAAAFPGVPGGAMDTTGLNLDGGSGRTPEAVAAAAEVLYGSETEVSASDRAAAALALQQLEALLGRKEVSAAALGQAARSLKTDVGRELHFSEKQVREVGVQWSNRGISTQKMPLLREVLSQSPRLVRLCLGGNKLCNEDVMELMLLLSEPSAPRRLGLSGVKLGDKGAAALAEGLRANSSLLELDLQRWNTLRAESGRVLEVALAGNAGLRELGLAHNGLADVDGARVLKGLLSHGKWLRVDLTHNNLAGRPRALQRQPSPAGMYSLDLAHPGTSALVSYLLRLRQTLEAAVAAGAAHGVALSLVDITVNGRPVRTDALAGLVAGWSEGRLELTVRAPAQLAVEAPAPLSAAVVEWLAGLMADPAASPLWKLAVAAGACCYFTPGQCVALLSGFDPQSAEFVAAAQMLYARSVQPLAFWQQVLPRFTPPQEEALRAMVGDLRALDLGCPMGRYALNLSRQVDRFVALRLQLASALEASWLGCRYYINWLNASLNGQPLDTAGLMRIRDFALPGAGVLRLDYVSYRKPGPDAVPASRDELAELQAVLRGINISHIAAGLAVRRIADPPPPPPKQEPPRSAHASRRKQQAPAAPPKPKPRLSALQLLRTPLEAAEHHASLLLAVHQAKDLPLLACKLGAAHLAAAVRKTLLGLMPLAPERLKCYEAAARAASEAALQRTRRVRTALNLWAAERYLSAEQLTAILGTLHYESDRITAMVVLWPRVVRGGWKRTYERLSPAEQRQVMMRLGHWHVYSCLADPHGIAFALDLGEPEQKDIARELGNIQTLLELRGNGNPVSIPEVSCCRDEKLWTMAESNFRTLDFLYSPTFEQSLAQVTASTVKIQRFWQGVRARRQAGSLPPPSPSALTDVEGIETSAEPSASA
eukprot:XP_001690546.1 predicted protein [Chlamydomonas reinhardtii]